MAECDYCRVHNHALCVPGQDAAYAGGAGANVVMRPCACARRKHEPTKRQAARRAAAAASLARHAPENENGVAVKKRPMKTPVLASYSLQLSVCECGGGARFHNQGCIRVLCQSVGLPVVAPGPDNVGVIVGVHLSDDRLRELLPGHKLLYLNSGQTLILPLSQATIPGVSNG